MSVSIQSEWQWGLHYLWLEYVFSVTLLYLWKQVRVFLSNTLYVQFVLIDTCTVNVKVNEEQFTTITNNSDILIYVGSKVTLQCICENDTVQWYYNGTNTSDGTLALMSLKQSNSGIYTCKGKIQTIPYNINFTVYSKSVCIELLS